MAELPSVENCISILQKYRKEKNLAWVKRVHAHIYNNGLEAHRAIGNHIVPMFVECGSVSDAQQLFNRLVQRKEHSWTSLMLGYIQCGQTQHALKLYQKMQEDNVHPSRYTLTALLRACARLKDFKRGREIHLEIAQKGFTKDIFVGSTLVDMYAKSGSLAEAQEVFDKLPIQHVASWTALISGYAEHGSGEKAIKCYEQMQLQGISADSVTLVCALKACGTIGAINKGRELHMEVLQKGFEKHIFVGSVLIDMYIKCGALGEASEVFNILPVRDVVSWTAIIAGYAEVGYYQQALKCFEHMELEGFSPNAVTFACVLKSCGRVGAIDKGREIHAEVARKGFERDIFIGNTLVTMYAKCGSLSEAQEVFDRLPAREIVSWAVLIGGYAEHGLGQESLKCFEQMQIHGVSPSDTTFVYALKACSSIQAIGMGRELHAEIVKKGFDRNNFVANTLVAMYAKCDSISEAQKVFDKLSVRDDVSWAALIAGYAEHGPSQEALICFGWMKLEGVSLNTATLAGVLKACGSIQAIGKGREIHAEIALMEFEADLSIGNTLVDMYAKCGSLLEAWEVFCKLPARDVVSWAALIAGHAEHGCTEDVLSYFGQMQVEGISPNVVTFVCILKACGSIGAICKGREIHAEIALKGFERDLFASNALIDMYSKCSSLSEAWEVFDKLSGRDVVSWATLIAAYAEHGSVKEVLKCFEQMQLEGIFPSVAIFVCTFKSFGSIGALNKGRELHAVLTYNRFDIDLFVSNTLIDMYAKCGWLFEAQEVFDKLPIRDVVSWATLVAGYADHGRSQEALERFGQMQLEGVSPDAAMFVCVLKACGSIRAIDKGREIHMEITRKGFEREHLVNSVLADMYVKCCSLLDACNICGKLAVRDVVLWTTLITGYAEHGPSQHVLELFEQMQSEGVSPDSVTYVCLLKACGSIGAIDKARKIHAEIVQEGFERDSFVGNTLVDIYAKCGSLSEAREIFNRLPVQGVMSWNAMIKGYGISHEGNMLLQCFEEMQKQGVKPNAVTFTCLLTSCSHSNLLFKGLEYFNAMREEYGITPTRDQYTCMVDLLARSGHLYEAENFIETSQCCLSEVAWTALLTACKVYGEVDLGLRCFQQLVQMHSESSASYVLMANIFLGAGRWDDASKIEELRKFLGVEKKPASALIEVNTMVHEFVVGDKLDEDVLAALRVLSSCMKGKGHVPNLDLVLKTC